MMDDPSAALSSPGPPLANTGAAPPHTHHAACTIVSPNYLAFARTLASSYLAHHPGHRFFVLIVADHVDVSRFANKEAGDRFLPVGLYQIGLSDLRAEAMKYDILELNTNVKPTFLKYLLSAVGIERLIYLDPDIFCYAPFTPVFAALEEHEAVLTPHLTAPIQDDLNPSEQDILYNGVYNLGFFAVRRSAASARILDWWESRCLALGFSEGRSGLFVDQKWMNLAPGLFDGIAILRHPGCNMAFWNLHERTLSGPPAAPHVNYSVPLCFFHFSGIYPLDPTQLSKNTDRFTLDSRPDLQALFRAYRIALLANEQAALQSEPYGFAAFSDGTAITRLSRRMYAKLQPSFPQVDPFDAAGPWLAFCRRKRLVAGKAAPPRATWKEFSGTDRRVETIHALLRLALRVLGPNRYELLMRYLGFITILRNQSDVLAGDRGRKAVKARTTS